MEKKLQIRNSTVEFLTFILDGKEDGVQVLYKDDTIWATQKAMAVLFEVDRTVITKHLKNIFQSGELQIDTVCAKIAHTAEDGKTYDTQYYSLDAIISVGYRINSMRATNFRRWSTAVLREFAKQFAESEFEKYRIIQDRLFESDFDRFNQNLLEFPDDIQ